MNFNGISYFTNAIYHKCQNGYLKNFSDYLFPSPCIIPRNKVILLYDNQCKQKNRHPLILFDMVSEPYPGEICPCPEPLQPETNQPGQTNTGRGGLYCILDQKSGPAARETQSSERVQILLSIHA